jgi:hypothetical protein
VFKEKTGRGDDEGGNRKQEEVMMGRKIIFTISTQKTLCFSLDKGTPLT